MEGEGRGEWCLCCACVFKLAFCFEQLHVYSIILMGAFCFDKKGLPFQDKPHIEERCDNRVTSLWTLS